ncbi:hypothetical protein ACQEV2_41490 [Streptomyces sp. CA-251387]|uniref:hypothetical protein n=1 Tax=Streptomyces sp. CA-251387 TaxID=3240064 RepID=UPI003D901F81
MVQDTKKDGRRAKIFAGYDYWTGSQWQWTTRTAATANGGHGSKDWNKQTARLPVKDFVFKVCTYDSSGMRTCSGWF